MIAGATVGAVAVLIILGVLVVVGAMFLTRRRSQEVKLLGYNVSLSLRYCVLYSEELCIKLLNFHRPSSTLMLLNTRKGSSFVHIDKRKPYAIIVLLL